MKKRMRKVQKLHVCKVYDEEDFRIEDEVNKDEITEDSAEKVEEIRLSILWITTLRLLIMLRIYLTLNMLKNYQVDMKEEATETAETLKQLNVKLVPFVGRAILILFFSWKSKRIWRQWTWRKK